jgi:hypothetical protein
MTRKERSMHRGPSTWLVVALLVLGASGCGEDSDGPVSPDGLSPLPGSADTPTNLLERFEATWELEVVAEYEALMTADFSFTFSSMSDPDLVNQYGSNWRRADEVASTDHLMTGFTDDEGVYQASASSIEFSLDGMSIIADPDHPDSAAWYKLAVVPAFIVQIQLNDTEQTEFLIQSPQDLYLVRGDAAVLASGQVARADRWYMRRWIDRTPQLAGPVILPASPHSWGRIKAQYR